MEPNYGAAASSAVPTSVAVANPGARSRTHWGLLLGFSASVAAGCGQTLHSGGALIFYDYWSVTLVISIGLFAASLIGIIGSQVTALRYQATHSAIVDALKDDRDNVLLLRLGADRYRRFAENECARRGEACWSDSPKVELLMVGPALGCFLAIMSIGLPFQEIIVRFLIAYIVGAALVFLRRLYYRCFDWLRRRRQMELSDTQYLVLFQQKGRPAAIFFATEAALLISEQRSTEIVRDYTERRCWMIVTYHQRSAFEPLTVERFPLEEGQEQLAMAWMRGRREAFGHDLLAEENQIGTYTMLESTRITAAVDVESEDLHVLDSGVEARVLEIQVCPADRVVRGRVAEPVAGWISLLNTRTGHRWAVLDLSISALRRQSRSTLHRRATMPSIRESGGSMTSGDEP